MKCINFILILSVLTLLFGCNSEGGSNGTSGNVDNANTDNSETPTVSPVFVQQAYLKASNAWSGDDFGNAVALDGNTLVVGAPYEDGDQSSTAQSPNDSANAAGAVYVFIHSNGTWSQQAYLKAGDTTPNRLFGQNIALDDDTLVVTGTGGGAYVFTRSGETWSQQAQLKVTNPPGGGFGAIALDDDTLAVGSILERGDANSTIENPNYNATQAGAVFVFTRSSGIWSQQAYLKASNAKAYDYFGGSIALDGDTLAVGASLLINVFNTNYSGGDAVYVFTRNGDSWSEQAYLKPGNAVSNIGFGHNVELDGDSLLVGGAGDDGDADSTSESPNYNAIDAGAAYVFTRNGGVWSQQAYLKASNAGHDHQFGKSIALDGDTLAVGAIGEPGDATSTAANANDYFSGHGAGAAYVFIRSNGVWHQQDYLKASNAGYEDRLGFSIALDGDTLAVGAVLEAGDPVSTVENPNDNAGGAGAVYVFH